MKIDRRGLMFIISGPSGTGKTTLTKELLSIDPHLHSSISFTTRKPRPGERDGVDYHFVDTKQFQQMIEDGEFLEYAQVFDNMYGTKRSTVEEYLERGEDVLFDIDWQGHRQVTGAARSDVASVYVFPPSKAELYHRLSNREKDSAVTARRMEEIDLELSHWHEYDYIIINQRIETSLSKLLSILRAERLRKERRLGLTDFFLGLMHEILPPAAH